MQIYIYNFFIFRVKMAQGKVKWFNPVKGYGFIEQENNRDLFVHKTDVIDRNIKEGDVVEFEVGEGRKGPCAVKVKIV